MQKHPSLARLLVVAVTAMIASRGFAADAEPPKAVFVDLDSAEAKPYRDTGDRAIDRFAYTLVSEAVSKVNRDGAAAAIAAGHLKGLPIINGNVAGVSRITAVKVTSLKLRSQTNAPDPAEKLALDKVQADLEAGSPPNLLVQRLDYADGKQEWRVYKPLAVLRQCLVCHGTDEDRPDEVKAALHEKYPDDQAAGYHVGELRGLIRVTVAPPPAPKPAPASPASAPAAPKH